MPEDAVVYNAGYYMTDAEFNEYHAMLYIVHEIGSNDLPTMIQGRIGLVEEAIGDILARNPDARIAIKSIGIGDTFDNPRMAIEIRRLQE